MFTYRILIEYEGEGYHGWQVQVDQITIQEVIEKALEILCGHKTRIIAAGRTDAGVHATGQVASFETVKEFDIYKTIHSLNALTPRDIAIVDMKKGPPGFDARRWATAREYKYYILNRPAPCALNRRYYWHIIHQIDWAAMEKGAAYLVGEHDFTSFRGAGCGARSPVRIMEKVKLIKTKNGLMEWRFKANGFLRHMIRNIMGALHFIGRGKMAPEGMEKLILEKDRRKAGPTAPAHGLIFFKVDYPKSVDPFLNSCFNPFDRETIL